MSMVCLGAMLKGSVPLAPICEFSENKTGARPPSFEWHHPDVFCQSIYGLVLTAIRFREMSRGDAAGNE